MANIYIRNYKVIFWDVKWKHKKRKKKITKIKSFPKLPTKTLALSSPQLFQTHHHTCCRKLLLSSPLSDVANCCWSILFRWCCYQCTTPHITQVWGYYNFMFLFYLILGLLWPIILFRFVLLTVVGHFYSEIFCYYT